MACREWLMHNGAVAMPNEVQLFFHHSPDVASSLSADEFLSVIKDYLYDHVREQDIPLDSLCFRLTQDHGLVVDGYFFDEAEPEPRELCQKVHLSGVTLEEVLLNALFPQPLSRIVINSEVLGIHGLIVGRR